MIYIEKGILEVMNIIVNVKWGSMFIIYLFSYVKFWELLKEIREALYLIGVYIDTSLQMSIWYRPSKKIPYFK